MLKRPKWGLVAAGLLGVLVLLSGCGGGDKRHGPLGTLKEGTLQAGLAVPAPPLEFGRAPAFKGFDVDFVRELARRLKLRPQFVQSPSAELLSGLKDDRFDIAASSVLIKQEKPDGIEFSTPYFPADQSLVVKKGSSIKTTYDLRDRLAGALDGTTGAAVVEDRKFGNKFRRFRSVDEAFRALEEGTIDGFIYDFAYSTWAVKSRPQLRVVQTIETADLYGVAVEEGSKDLLRAINRAISNMKGDGTYVRIYKKWFKLPPPLAIINTPDVPE